MNPLEKAQVPVASSALNKFPLHRGHVTTTSFMRFDCAMAREIAPNSHYKGNHQTVLRTLPLKRPYYGNVMVHSSAYFVPFRVVWEPFTSLVTNSPYNTYSGTTIHSEVPFISDKDWWKFFLNQCATKIVDPNFDPYNDVFDFAYQVPNSTTIEYFKVNRFGQFVWSLMVQLGYKFNPLNQFDYKFSALPLLCAAKVYLDFYFPNAYAHYGMYATLEGIFNRDFYYGLTDSDLLVIFSVIQFVSYNSNYFNNAFDNPTGPNDYTGSLDFSINDISNNAVLNGIRTGQVVTNDPNIPNPTIAGYKPTNGTPFVGNNMNTGQATTVGVLTQYTLDSLRALTNYVRRNQLVGSRNLERYLSRWGLALSADKLRRCIRLDSTKYPMQVADIMASSDTYNSSSNSGAVLGEYAGKSIGYDGNLNIDFETSEFGYFLIFTTLVPDADYVQGYDKFTKHLTRFDFLTGEFDGLGCQPIEQGELFVGLKRQSTNDDLFGFLPRYAEYKTIKSVLSGNFLFDSLNGGLKGWDTARLFSDQFGDSAFNLAHSLDFMLGKDADTFNRLFIDDQDDSDKYILVHRDNIALIQPAVPLFDMYDFHDDTGKTVTVESNGVKEN